MESWEHRVNVPDPVDWNGDLESENSVQVSWEHWIDVPEPVDVIGNLDSEYRVQAFRQAMNGNLDSEYRVQAFCQAMNGNLIRTVLFQVGFLTVAASGAWIFTLPFGLFSGPQIFIFNCSSFVGMMLIFLAVVFL